MKFRNFLSQLFLNPENKQKPPARSFRERAPRVRLSELHNLSFVLKDGNRAIPIANISVSGIGILAESVSFLRPPLSAGLVIEGELFILNFPHRIQVKIAHASEDVIGCSFVTPSSDLTNSIDQYFKAELAALKVSKVPSENLQHDPDGSPHWYCGSNNCELYYVSNSANIVSFQLVLFGNYIEGGSGLPLKFGQVLEDKPFEKPSHKGSPLLLTSSSSDPELIRSARMFLTTLDKIDDTHRAELLKLLSSQR